MAISDLGLFNRSVRPVQFLFGNRFFANDHAALRWAEMLGRHYASGPGFFFAHPLGSVSEDQWLSIPEISLCYAMKLDTARRRCPYNGFGIWIYDGSPLLTSKDSGGWLGYALGVSPTLRSNPRT